MHAILAASAPTFWLPGGASTVSGQVDNLFNIILWICIFFFLLVSILLVLFAVIYRHKPGKTVDTAAGHSTSLELTWTLIPSIIVVFLYYYGFRHYMEMTIEPAYSYEITAVGKMWQWSFRYPTGLEANELHIPINTPVRAVLSSNDVIHSLYIPAFRVKKDVVPGRFNRMWFQATDANYALYATVVTIDGKPAIVAVDSDGNPVTSGVRLDLGVVGGSTTTVPATSAPSTTPTSGSLKFEGRATNWDQLDATLGSLPFHGATVLELAQGSEKAPPEAQERANALVKKWGLKRLGDVSSELTPKQSSENFGKLPPAVQAALSAGGATFSGDDTVREMMLCNGATVYLTISTTGGSPTLVATDAVGSQVKATAEFGRLPSAVRRAIGEGAHGEPPANQQVLVFPDAQPYDIYCAAYCGTNHSIMRSRVIVHRTQADFDSWLKQQTELANNLPPVQKGEKLYRTQGCSQCHSVDGSKLVGPSWKDAWGRTETMSDGSQVLVDAAYVRESILQPQAKIVQGYPPSMPPFVLKDADIEAIMAYLKSISSHTSQAELANLNGPAATQPAGGPATQPASMPAEKK